MFAAQERFATMSCMAQALDYRGVDCVVSGGQTGVDRAGLDTAILLGIRHGGWCPRGRLAEDGAVPPIYELDETRSAEYPVRTEQNVIDSDGTLILYRVNLFGGSELTHRLTRKHTRPCLLVDLEDSPDLSRSQHWLRKNAIHVLNVAGPRESSAAGIGNQAAEYLRSVLSNWP